MIRRYVVDASVVAKWYFQEEHSDRADALLEQSNEILAPDILLVEVAALAWQRARRGEINEATADRIVAELRKVPLDLRPTAELVSAALPLALQKGITLFDGFYIALAVQSGCPLITADRHLYDALRTDPLAEHALWIGDFA